MMIDATSFLMMLACTGFVVLTANIISKGFEALWAHVYPQAAIAGAAEPILDERHLLPPAQNLLPPARDFDTDDLI